MRYLRRNGKTILSGILELVVGILLFINPEGLTNVIFKGIGIVLLFCGAFCAVQYFRTEPMRAVLEQNLFKGLLMLLVGCCLTFYTGVLGTVFAELARVYGLVILIAGIMKIQQTVDLLRLKVRFWFLSVLGALAALVFAGLLLFYPFETAGALWQLAAISLIVEAVLDIVLLLFTGGGKRMSDDVWSDEQK